jgi:hypothetical protein
MLLSKRWIRGRNGKGEMYGLGRIGKRMEEWMDGMGVGE